MTNKPMTEQDKQEAFAELHYRIVGYLDRIEQACRQQGLRSITNFTVIARDPDNDDMCVVVTNDDLDDAIRVALEHAKQRVA